ncbi:MAG: hypothetical protein ACRD4K_04360 [Candidatus Acidiferrales bacterium]
MKFAQGFWFCALCLMSATAAKAQATPTREGLHAEILRTYNSQSHTLNNDQLAQASTRLDQFWEKARSQRGTYVLGLRRELTDFSNPPFFLFDGSQLLLSLSRDPADRKIALAAIAHSDLQDIQWRDYFLLVHGMAAQGEDTTAAAFNILGLPKFQVIIPEHALTHWQDFCLIYMLLPTDQAFWLRPAIERLHAQSDVAAQKSLLLLLWYAQTPESDKAIAGFSGQAGVPQASKDFANQLIHREVSVDATTRAALLTTSEESLRLARRERMKAVSDEALYDLDSYTSKIIAKRK